MIILSGGDDNRMRDIITKALTDAREPYVITDDESDIISVEQAIGLGVYNASKIRIYVGRLERNTRKLEETLSDLVYVLEPIGAYLEEMVDEDRSERESPRARIARIRQKSPRT